MKTNCYGEKWTDSNGTSYDARPGNARTLSKYPIGSVWREGGFRFTIVEYVTDLHYGPGFLVCVSSPDFEQCYRTVPKIIFVNGARLRSLSRLL